jgi:hypothetical protein
VKLDATDVGPTRGSTDSLTLEPLEQRQGPRPATRVSKRGSTDQPPADPLGGLGQVPMEVTYHQRIGWRAFYMGTLTPDETKLKLDGFVRVDNNSGEEYEDAQTRLVVGQVHLLEQITELSDREWAYNRHSLEKIPAIQLNVDFADKFDGDAIATNGAWAFGVGRTGGMGGGGGRMKIKEVLKEGLSEYNLYTIEGLETIPHSWGKRLPSFKADEVPVESVYKYDPSRWGTETIQYLSFTNDKKNKLGDNALPEGNMRIFRDTTRETADMSARGRQVHPRQ